jgi:putative ABC transport system permease protein
MNTFLADFKYSIRTLQRSPGFALFAILALALGIGANVAVFSAVDAMLLRPMQFREASRLVKVWEDGSKLGFPHNTPAPANFVDWKARNHVFEDMAALQGNIYAITGDGPPEQVEGSPVTANLFPLLGVTPVLGRNFLPEEDKPGGPKVAILSFRLWQQRYGADRSVIGRGIRLDGGTYQIIGIMPRGFIFPDRSDVWVPIAFRPNQLAQRSNHYLNVFARLKHGVTVESAQREMAGIAAQLAREYPATNAWVTGAAVIGLREEILGDVRLGLWVLGCGVGCVLLIACANVAGLLLARAAGREREMAVRAALGAGRLRLIRQSLTEALALSLAGGVVGFMFAMWTIPFLQRLVPKTLAGWSQPHLDWRLLGFAFLISMVSALVFGATPAVSISEVDLSNALQRGGRGGIGGRTSLRRWLVISEVAIAVVLSVGAGLLVRTLWTLAHVELGFRPEGVLTMRTNLPGSAESAYGNFPARADFYQRVLEKVRSIPGVVSAGYTTFLPLTNRGGTSGFTIEGAPPPVPGQDNDANHRVVSAEYLQTIGVRLRAGRHFTRFDGPEQAPVAIVNEAMARQYWPGQDPLGHRFRLGRANAPWITIVGIVDNVRQMGLDVAGRAEMYFPCTQPAAAFGYFTPRDLAVRVEGDPLRYSAAVREAIWAIDRNQPVSSVMPMTQFVSEELAAREVEVELLGVFAGLALLLAAIGLYGLLAYTVVQRMREIGVRIALGAQPRQVLRATMGEGLRLVLAGLAIGSAGAWALTGAMQKLLYGVKAGDPVTFAIAAALLVVVGLLACYVPARRAASIDPMVALRYE